MSNFFQGWSEKKNPQIIPLHRALGFSRLGVIAIEAIGFYFFNTRACQTDRPNFSRNSVEGQTRVSDLKAVFSRGGS